MNTAQATTVVPNEVTDNQQGSASVGLLSDEDKSKVEQFCEAVRAKQKWYNKILDEERDLGTKWAHEAGYLQLGPDGQTSCAPVDFAIRDAIEDLKGEANRIRVFDHTTTPYYSRPERPVDYQKINQDVLTALKYLRSAPFAIQKARLRQDTGIFVSDGAVPESLHRELLTELNALATAEPKDFHPGTLGKVQDLIHPSMYPYIAGVTQSRRESPMLVDGTFKTKKIEKMGPYHSETQFLESKYTWIPTVFRVSDDGMDVHIQDYINGLGPRADFPTLYRVIEKLFLIALPHFEKTMAKHRFTPTESPSVVRWNARVRKRDDCTRKKWNALLKKQAAQKTKQGTLLKAELEEKQAIRDLDWLRRSDFVNVDDAVAASKLRGQPLKVIVKAANYILRPGQEYEGTWHLEGMPHERIVASVIYYYETDPNIQDPGLSFRYLRCLETDFPNDEYHHSDNFYNEFGPGGGDEGDDDGGDDNDNSEDVDDEGEDDESGDEKEEEADDNVSATAIDDDAGEDVDNNDAGGEVDDDDGEENSDNEEDSDKEQEGDGEEEAEDDGTNDNEAQANDEDSYDYPSDWETVVGLDGIARPMSLSGMNKYISIGTVPTTNFAEKHATRDQMKAVASKSFHKEDVPAKIDDQELKKPTTGRMISFPNWVQHKVESVKNSSDSAIAQRKILCFFLVDDEIQPNEDDIGTDGDPATSQEDVLHYHSFSYHGLKNGSVLTTSDVPWQRREPTLYDLLPLVCRVLTGKSLPAELVAHIINLGNLGLSREMAEVHRRLLMKDRKIVPIGAEYGSDMYSLCEH